MTEPTNPATKMLHDRFEITHATLQVMNEPFTVPCGDWRSTPAQSNTPADHHAGHHHTHP